MLSADDFTKIRVTPTALLCPYCGIKTHFDLVTHAWDFVDKEKRKVWAIQRCNNCSRLVLTIFQFSNRWIAPPGEGNVPLVDTPPEEIFPYSRFKPHGSIPKEAAEDYAEAILCYSAGAYNASVVMSRKAIQTAAILLGADKEDKLVDQIRSLASKGLEKSLIDLATEIRELGNVPGAHPDSHDLTRKVQRDESKEVLDFLEAFLESLFIRPSRIQALRTKRTSRKEPP